jgi:hypothetical protein
MASDTDTEVSPEDIMAMPPSEESFDSEAVPVFLDLIQDKLREYIRQQMENDEPIAVIGFGMELIYQVGFTDGGRARRAR